VGAWNAGGGARAMGTVIAESGYHIMAVQEARSDFLQLDGARWSSTLVASQCFLARWRAVVHPMACDQEDRCAWLLAEVRFPEPILGFEVLRVMSLHLNSVQAKKPVGGPTALGEALDEASRHRTIDVLCGDINMARFRKAAAPMSRSLFPLLRPWRGRTQRKPAGTAPLGPVPPPAHGVAMPRALPPPLPRPYGPDDPDLRPQCPHTPVAGGGWLEGIFGAPAQASTEQEREEWHEGTLQVLHERGIEPVSAWAGECCFVGLRREHMQRLQCRGSCWGQRGSGDEEWRAFLTRCGARITSKDVHWPLSLCLRWSTDLRASGLRRRSAEKQLSRVEKKVQRGILPASWATRGASSSAASSAAPKSGRSPGPAP